MKQDRDNTTARGVTYCRTCGNTLASNEYPTKKGACPHCGDVAWICEDHRDYQERAVRREAQMRGARA